MTGATAISLGALSMGGGVGPPASLGQNVQCIKNLQFPLEFDEIWWDCSIRETTISPNFIKFRQKLKIFLCIAHFGLYYADRLMEQHATLLDQMAWTLFCLKIAVARRALGQPEIISLKKFIYFNTKKMNSTLIFAAIFFSIQKPFKKVQSWKN